MQFKLTLRSTFVLILVPCSAWLAYALLTLYFTNTAVSPLAILQCYGLGVAAGATSLGAWHNTRSAMRRVYAGLTLLALCMSLGAALESLGHSVTGANEPNHALAQTMIVHLPLAPRLQAQLGTSQPSLQPLQELPFEAVSTRWNLWAYAVLALLALWQTCRKTPERRRFG